MNCLLFYTSLYGFLKSYGMPVWVMTPLRRLIRSMANRHLPIYFKNNRINDYDGRRVKGNLIVSFTSFPTRIHNVWQVVECFKRQTLLPSKIILWLSKEQFPSEAIPDNLKEEIDELFEVRFVDGDIRSHKKYYYTAKEFPDKLIFLADDDIYYSPTLLERIYKAHLQSPDCIISNYGFRIRYDINGEHLPYASWIQNYKDSISDDLFFGSGGGTLIQPSLMYKDLTNIELARQMTPLADDVWLNAMTKLAHTKIHMIKNGVFLSIVTHSDVKLTTQNDGQNLNDVQIAAVTEFYKRKIL